MVKGIGLVGGTFPIEVFDRTDGRSPRWPTFGIRLSASRTPRSGRSTTRTGTFSLALAMAGTMTSFHDQLHVEDPVALARTMFVDTFGVRATAFDIDEKIQDLLFKRAKATTEFLKGWDFDRYPQEVRSGGRSSTSPTSSKARREREAQRGAGSSRTRRTGPYGMRNNT